MTGKICFMAPSWWAVYRSQQLYVSHNSQVLVTRQQVQTTGSISVKSAQTSHFCYCYFPGIHQIQGLFIRARLTVLARLPGWILPWVHMRNFSPVSEIRKGQRSWERVPAPNSGNKANMSKHKILTFGPILPSVTLKAVSLQLNGMLMMWKIQQAMQDDAIWTARIHSAIHPGNWDEVFIWQNF